MCIPAFAQVTTEGTDFWFGFLENDLTDGRDVFLELYVSAKENANIRLSNASGSYVVEGAISANTSEVIEVPIEFMPLTSGKTDLGLHLTADVAVSLYALNKAIYSADAAVILPTPALGQKYYVVAHKEPPGDEVAGSKASVATVVSTADDTKVAITPSVDIDTGWPAGETREVILNQGETYFLRSETEDLTGTAIEVVENGDACASVAVFGGNRFTNVGGCGGFRDHLYEQMFPVNTWGKRFVWVTYETRLGGDYMKVMASEDNTVIDISDWGTIELDAGETEIVKALTGPRYISASKPIQVAQYSRSQECDMVTNSDPFMIMLSPMAQRINQATFDLFVVDQIERYYITLITIPGGDSGVTLDGLDISDRFQGTPGASYASFEIERGTHTVVAPEGVIAYVYGYGESESFGYSAGVSLQNLSVDIEGQDFVLGVDAIGNEACINSPIVFNALFETEAGEDSPFIQFDWDFGDGSTGTGQGAVHAFDAGGTYEVTLVASDGQSKCGGNVEVVVGSITINEVLVDDPGIVGTGSVCPEVEGVTYSVSGDSRNTYEWQVTGGEIAGDNTGSEITVNWGLTNAAAMVEVIPISGDGCRGNPISKLVTINTRLEPDRPLGNSEVCVGDLGNAVYFTPSTPGSQYQWEVEGGSILSGAGSNEVTVVWENVSNGRIWYREFNPAIADCEGTSEALEVRIYPALIVESTVSNVLCFGGSDGAINLEVSGGQSGPYTVSWSNGMTGLDISGLPIGQYTAIVQDITGCQFVQEFIITEPEELLITGATVDNVRCFEEGNGMIALDMTGGTPDAGGNYQFTWSAVGFTRTTNQPFAGSLEAGVYTVMVTDVNGCTATSSYTIEEPPLLIADLTTLINRPVCIGASNGTAYVEAKGGTPDYQFYWSNNPATEQQQGENFSRGTYTLRIVDANGCEATLPVEVSERYPQIYMPNAFSPNGDGENEEFKAVTDCQLQYSMQVFNEWGSVIFATTDIDAGWNGELESQEAPIGKYSYIIFYAGEINGVSFDETLRGTFRLIR